MLEATGQQFLALATWMILILSWTMASYLASMPLDHGWDSNFLVTPGLAGLELEKAIIISWLFYMILKTDSRFFLGLEAFMLLSK